MLTTGLLGRNDQCVSSHTILVPLLVKKNLPRKGLCCSRRNKALTNAKSHAGALSAGKWPLLTSLQQLVLATGSAG